MRPRLGFLGLGWIGSHRMQALIAAGTADVVAIGDPSAERLQAAAILAPQARCADSLEAVLDAGVDGVVIATPSALHADQAITALRLGVAVFCQKPLGRSASEVARVVAAARDADRLLGVDLSYRHTAGMDAIRTRIGSGAIGRVYAAELVFHNAYGPDKPWFYDRAQSGGGCVMDLGVHLVDLCLWTLGFPTVRDVTARLFSGGTPLAGDPSAIEDYATAQLHLAGGVSVQLACSWKLNLGCDAAISAVFHGTEGGIALRNVDGSFYDFTAELYQGTQRRTLAEPPDAWGGRGLVLWAERLARSVSFDRSCETLIDVAQVIDRIYESRTAAT